MDLPNDFYDSLEGIRGYKVKLICFGVERSATTLIFQLATSLLDSGVIKTHSFLDLPRVPAIVTVRDFRDCTVSWAQVMRMHGYKENTDYKLTPRELHPTESMTPRYRPITLEDAVNATSRIKGDVAALDAYVRRGFGVLRYERFTTNTEFVRSAFSGLGLFVTDEMLERFSLKSNWRLKRFTHRLETEDELNEPTAFGHCGDGKIRKWRECSDEVLEYLNDVWRDDLARYGYTEGT